MRIAFTDLEPEWVSDVPETPGARRRDPTLTIETAQGVMFLCPVCFERNGGPRGTHSILCWFRGRGVPDDETPGPGRWDVSGTGLHDLTLHPSVDISMNDPTEWHGWIKDGVVT